MNAFVTRTELFEFWPLTVTYASLFQSVSYSGKRIDVKPCCASWITRSM